MNVKVSVIECTNRFQLKIKGHKLKTFLLVMLFSFSLSAEQFLYVTASGDQAIEVYKINSENGNLELHQKVSVKGQPGNGALSPDKKFYYVAIRSKGNLGIYTFKIAEDAKISQVGFASTPGNCGFLDVDKTGKYIFASHYGEGSISCYELEEGIYKGKVLKFEESDERAHSIRIDRNNKYVYVPHTSPNKVYQYQFNNGALSSLNPAYTKGPNTDNNYHEPRHFVFHPQKDLIYTSNERGGGISSWKISEEGKLTLWQTFSTLPKGFNWNAAASDIQISSDGRFAYVANRDNTNRKSPTGNDSIASFIIDEKSGEIVKRTGITSVGRHPRSLRIDVSGKFLYGAGVNSSNITLYSINQQDGSLTKIKEFKTGKGPMWLTCLEK